MGVQWTKEQQEVIRLRDRNILVSAAAGSGKTAVLVERILSKITDKEHPVDIDRLLIMTFTRAAAGEMKERISAAIEKALCEDPDNEHLQRQTTLLHTAQITTIDGFCAYIIRNYFHLIGLDPGYRTADEGELKLLRGDVVKALLEEYYAKKDEKFQKFVECFATGKSDENLGNLIQKLYEMAMSNPFPQEWLSGCMDDYRIDSLEELRETEWMRMLWDAVKDELQEAKLLVQEARRICSEPDGPYLYDEALSSDLLLIRSLQELAEKRDYNGTAEILMKPSFARLSTKKAADVDEQKKQRVKDLRDEEKGILKELGQRWQHHVQEEVERCDQLAGSIERLASRIDKAAGGDGSTAMRTARERFYYRLDLPFREWLLSIDPEINLREQREIRLLWREQVKRIALSLANELVEQGGIAALVGRTVKEKVKNREETHTYCSPKAFNQFISELHRWEGTES